MKISTIRSLLILLDLLLLAGIAAIVYSGLKDRDKRKDRRGDYQQRINALLAEAKSGPLTSAARETNPAIDALNLSNRKVKVVEAVVEQPKEATPTSLRPLHEFMQLVGTEVHSDDMATPSFVLWKEPGADGGGSMATRPPARASPAIRSPGRPTPPPLGGALVAPVVFRVSKGEAIEFSEREVAILKDVLPEGRAVFIYGGQEVTLEVAVERSGTGPGGGGAPPPPDTSPINPDPGTWISWNPDEPKPIRITPMGMRAATPESVLDGVTTSTERLAADGLPAIKLTTVPKDSALAKAGAQDGDILISINDKRITSKPEAVRYVKDNPNLSSYEVQFRRRGVTYTRVVMPPPSGGAP
jgi:membrane-associated protease RseP (regulator of RpoE activity)